MMKPKRYACHAKLNGREYRFLAERIGDGHRKANAWASQHGHEDPYENSGELVIYDTRKNTASTYPLAVQSAAFIDRPNT